jgi:Mn2+/Fe2+ NRAMP family transporter
MKQIIQQVLDFPQMVNQKYLKFGVNESVDSFDSEQGVRSYVAKLYQFIALALLISMEYNVIISALAYFQGEAGGLQKLLSVVTVLVAIATAFPIAKAIRTRGDSFKSKHSSMIEFVFSDFVKTNIQLLGEVMAIAGLFSAANLTFSFIVDHDLFAGNNMGMDLLGVLAPIAAFPMVLLAKLLGIAGADGIGETFSSITAYRMEAASTSFGGDFQWNITDILNVLSAYLNVMISLAMMYISLTIYKYTYGLIVSVIKWVANPFIPLLIKNK